MNNYSQYAEDTAPTSEDSLAVLSKLAVELSEADAEVARIEEELRKAKEKQKDISEYRIPQLMDEIGIEEYKTTSGLKLQVKETIHASVTKAKMTAASRWLDEHGHSALVKRKVLVEFDKDEEEEAQALYDELLNKDTRLRVGQDLTIHPSTLRAWVKEQLESGEDIDLDLFGVYRSRTAKIST